MPSGPVIFSKSTNPHWSQFMFTIDVPKYVPFQFDLRIVPQYGRGSSDVIMFKKMELALDSWMVYAWFVDG